MSARVCLNCGKSIEDRRSDALYCSTTCSRNYTRRHGKPASEGRVWVAAHWRSKPRRARHTPDLAVAL